jgi:hypothetical protein
MVILLTPACTQKDERPPVVEQKAKEEADEGPAQPSEVELSDLKATQDGRTVMFQFKYRFTKGRPRQTYRFDISFPGTPNNRVMHLEAWQLLQRGKEGLLRDGVELSKLPVSTLEIVMLEAPTPRDRYTKISNVVKASVD